MSNPCRARATACRAPSICSTATRSSRRCRRRFASCVDAARSAAHGRFDQSPRRRARRQPAGHDARLRRRDPERGPRPARAQLGCAVRLRHLHVDGLAVRRSAADVLGVEPRGRRRGGARVPPARHRGRRSEVAERPDLAAAQARRNPDRDARRIRRPGAGGDRHRHQHAHAGAGAPHAGGTAGRAHRGRARDHARAHADAKCADRDAGGGDDEDAADVRRNAASSRSPTSGAGSIRSPTRRCA